VHERLVDLYSAFYWKAEEAGDLKAFKAVELIVLINELFVCPLGKLICIAAAAVMKHCRHIIRLFCD